MNKHAKTNQILVRKLTEDLSKELGFNVNLTVLSKMMGMTSHYMSNAAISGSVNREALTNLCDKFHLDINDYIEKPQRESFSAKPSCDDDTTLMALSRLYDLLDTCLRELLNAHAELRKEVNETREAVKNINFTVGRVVAKEIDIEQKIEELNELWSDNK